MASVWLECQWYVNPKAQPNLRSKERWLLSYKGAQTELIAEDQCSTSE